MYSYHHGGCFIPVNIAWQLQLKAPNQVVGLDAGLFEVKHLYMYCNALEDRVATKSLVEKTAIGYFGIEDYQINCQ